MLLIAVGLFLTLLALPFAFIAVIGLIQGLYGVSLRGRASQELGTMQQGAEKEQTVRPSGADQANVDTLYDELLDKYVMHWRIESGAETLDNEIKAYVWAGASFSEAVQGL
jgi:hypothetical protein